ncbi:hypothetical protein BDY19DRAFT_992335 [Irpex rosettiformis]|uniref:Uncharacterized protein n=1 Tax=Irpex rosettiformis TaxID=378272 RepID=A0ACB8U764_9APHY|nr:hypothetical protein BDY19DRAFT_992335 [Irpex rosettiformis]
MQYPPTPSSTRSGRALAPAPSRAGGHSSATPSAPYMSSRDLPPTPYTPGTAQLPATPYMSTIPLPGMQPLPPFGLLTPPASPARPRGQLVLHHILSPQYAAALHFDMRYPIEHIRFAPGYDASLLDALATNPPVGQLQIVVFFDTIRINVSNQRGVTVRDVFHRLYRELSKCAEPVEVMRAGQAKGVQTAAPGHAVRRIDLLAPSVVFAGLCHSGEGFSLIVRA